MTALARIEARHLARSPLLWLGLVLGVAFATLNMVPWSSWPVLSRDDLIIYTTGGPLLSGGAVLAGAWLALRDRTSGAADLVAVTSTAPWRLWWARLAGVAVAAASRICGCWPTGHWRRCSAVGWGWPSAA